jgi:hypothetical protein
MHPLITDVVWDLRLKPLLEGSYDTFCQTITNLLPDIAHSSIECFAKEALENELLKLYHTSFKIAGTTRVSLLWHQIFFMPTRTDRPRKRKRARGIRKRLAKRLVRTTGRRF